MDKNFLMTYPALLSPFFLVCGERQFEDDKTFDNDEHKSFQLILNFTFLALLCVLFFFFLNSLVSLSVLCPSSMLNQYITHVLRM